MKILFATIRLNPKYVDAYINRGIAYNEKKEYGKAIEDCSQAIRLDPKSADSHNALAWVFATCPKEGVRDGKKAIEHATRACELSQWKNAYMLDSLAAAHAETGNFKDASKWQKAAIEMGYDDKEDTEKARQRLKLYEEGKPYREK